MATQVQFRGGTTTEHASFNGAAREVTVDTTKQTLVVQDGTTNGGFPLLRQKNPDNTKLEFGGNGTTDAGDLQIAHGFLSANLSSIVNTGAAGLAVRSDIIMLQNDAGDHDYITTAAEAGVTLYYDNVPKLYTNANGVKIQGTEVHFVAPDGGNRYYFGEMGDSASAQLSLYNKDDAQKVRIAAGDGANEASTYFNGGPVGIGTVSPTGIHNLAKVLEISGGDGGDLIIGNSVSTNVGAGAHMGAVAFKNIDSATGSPHYAGIRCEAIDTSGNMDLRFYTGSGNLEDDTPQVIMTGNNVGIGTTSPGSYYSKNLVIDGGASGGITIVGGTTQSNFICFADGTSGGAQYAGYVGYNHNADELNIRANNGTKGIDIQSDGDLSITDGNLVVANGHGIDFSAVELDDSDAADGYSVYGSLLDDYERGTWTPQWAGSTSDPSVTYTSNGQLGYYHKVGRRVYFQIYLCLASSGNSSVGGSGTLCITGFPYAADTAVSGPNVAFGGGVVAYNDKMGSSSIKNLLISGTALYCYNGVDGNGSSTSKATTDLTNSSQIRIFGSYITNV